MALCLKGSFKNSKKENSTLCYLDLLIDLYVHLLGLLIQFKSQFESKYQLGIYNTQWGQNLCKIAYTYY